MPSYEVKLPDGSTYDVDSPSPLSDEQAYQAVMADLKGRQLPVSTNPPMTPMTGLGEAFGQRLMGEVPPPTNPSVPEYLAEKAFWLLGALPRAMKQGLQAPMGSPEQQAAAREFALGGLHVAPMPGTFARFRTADTAGFPPTPPIPKGTQALPGGPRQPLALPPAPGAGEPLALPGEVEIGMPGGGVLKRDIETAGPKLFKAQPSASPELPAAYNELAAQAGEVTGDWGLRATERPRLEAVPRPAPRPSPEPVENVLASPRAASKVRSVDSQVVDGEPEAPVTITTKDRAATPRSNIFSKENLPDDQPLVSTYAERVKDTAAAKLKRWTDKYIPKTAEIAVNHPDTPLFTETQRLLQAGNNKTYEFSKSAAARDLYKYTADEWADAEQIGFDALRASGSRKKGIQAIQEKYPEIANLIERKAQQIDAIQQARRDLGLPEIPERDLVAIYFPRMTDLETAGVTYVGRPSTGLRTLRTTIGSFMKPRTNNLTMLEMQQRGMGEFRDPRLAYLYNERLKDELISTAEFTKNLEGEVLFNSRKDAVAAGYKQPQQVEAFVVGGRSWWVPDKDIALYLKDNFERANSPWNELWGYSNQLFRNPNLINPIPHIKNMTWLYKQSGGKMSRLFDRTYEYLANRNPERRALFEEFVPHAETPKTQTQLFDRMANKITGERYYRDLAEDIVASANKPSQKVLWKWADPAIKYARWVQYLEEGMSPQAAANHVLQDLVMYSERSRMIDWLKNVPLNFFVPWRWGNFASTLKATRDHPLGVALTVGVIDTIREMIYRNTGWWASLPIDHLEAPIYDLAHAGNAAMHGEVFDAMAHTGDAIIGTFAPSVGAKMADLLNPTDIKRFWSIMWGWSQVYEMGQYIQQAHDENDPAQALKVLAVALGARNTIQQNQENKAPTSYLPRRLGAAIPESVFPKTWKVKQAELEREARLQKQKDAIAERTWRQAPRVATVLSELGLMRK